MKHEIFARELEVWLKRWVEREIIDEAQQEQLLADVWSVEAQQRQRLRRDVAGARQAEEKTVMGRLPAILIGLATILLCVGIMLFYAANWRKMAPSFKLIQVFCLHLGLNLASYYLLAVKKDHQRIGRAFLIMGMVSFGAAISLIAQIYHISAHPTNGVLVWALGVMLMSWVMRERWGAYLSAGLVLIWQYWESTVYGDPNWLFLLVFAALLGLFVRIRERVGVVLCFALALFWGYAAQANALRRFNEIMAMCYAFLHLPFGVCLLLIARALKPYALFQWGSRFLSAAGWLAVFVPFIGLSWPIQLQDALFPFTHSSSRVLAIEYMLFMGLAAGLLFWLSKRDGEDSPFASQLLGAALLFLVLPAGNKKILITVMHVALLAFLFAFLYFSHTRHPQRSLERFFAFAFIYLAMAIKLLGLFALGVSKQQFYVAYILGFAVFGTVCFLGNQLIRYFLEKQGHAFPGHRISVFSAFLAFWCFYALSFKVRAQASIFTVDAFIITLLLVLIGLAVVLYGFLLKNSPDTLILKLSFVVFACIVGVLFLAGPGISKFVYPLVFNILLFALLGTMLYYSTKINSKQLLNFALSGFVLQMVSRYFDVLWDLLSGSALFITTGLLVLAGGYVLDRKRRELLESIDEHREQIQRGGVA